MGQGGDVEEVVLRPMRAMFPAPLHLRCDPAALELALATYRRALGRFERPVLERGWQKAAEENQLWTWPKLADLVGACEHFRRQGHHRAGRDVDGWVEEATALAHSYTRRFMERSQVAARSRAGGWEAPLRRYVEAAAWVQAQYILGQENIGYSSTILFGTAPRAGREGQVRDFFERAREQAAKGHVRVHVPHCKAREWERSCAVDLGRAR